MRVTRNSSGSGGGDGGSPSTATQASHANFYNGPNVENPEQGTTDHKEGIKILDADSAMARFSLINIAAYPMYLRFGDQDSDSPTIFASGTYDDEATFDIVIPPGQPAPDYVYQGWQDRMWKGNLFAAWPDAPESGDTYADIVLADGGVSFRINNGGADHDVSIPDGSYTPSDLMALIETELNDWLDSLGLPGMAPFRVALYTGLEPWSSPPTNELGDPPEVGSVCIRNNLVTPSEGAQTNFELTWVSLDLRDGLGFADDHSAEGGSVFIASTALTASGGTTIVLAKVTKYSP